MKKILLIVLALGMCHTVFSQRRVVFVKPMATNEIKLNLATTLFSLPEISYERVWGNNVGLGVAARLTLTDCYDTRYLFMPYCRFYFGETPIKSFFVEGNLGIMGYKKDKNYTNYNNGTVTSTYISNAETAGDVGVGVAVGYKYINRNGLIAEVFVGLGRTADDRMYSRCGVSMGKMFF